MKYIATVNGTRLEVERDERVVRVGDLTTEASLEAVGDTPVRIVRIGDEVYRVIVRPRIRKGYYRLWIDGYAYEVEALDERAQAIRDLSGAAEAATGPARLVAPMPD